MHSTWRFALAEGILFCVLGLLAMMLPGVFTFSIALLIGWLFLIGGVFKLVRSIQARHEDGFGGALLFSIVMILAGLLLVNRPLLAAFSLTILLASFFMVAGVVKIYLAFQLRSSSRWKLVMANGVIAILFSLLIWSGLPETAFWLIGFLVGFDMVFFGFSLILLSLESRHMHLEP